MNFGIIGYIVGVVMTIEGAAMLLPWIVSLIYGESSGISFLVCAIISGAIGLLITRRKPKNTAFFAREGFVMVSLSWIVISLIGAIPFVVSGEIPNVVDALFEIVSGFTTTGSSILTDVESLSKCMLFWRSFSHWIGGMGVLVFILAILPMAGGQNIYLMKAESTGPSVGKLVPKVQKTAFWLYGIYTAMTLMQLVLLLIGKVPVFDAFCLAFGTAGTGGFGVLGDSFVSYSAFAQNATIVFMLLFGVNFNFYFFILSRRYKNALAMEDVRWYFIIYIISSAIITINLIFSGMFNGLREVLFQTSSVMTSTGFASADFNLWPSLSRALMIMLMFVGACGGSTGGGMKVTRYVIYAKTVAKEIRQLAHPRSVKILKMDGKPIEHEVIRIVNVYLCTFILVFAASLIIILTDNFDLTTSFTAVAATLNNIGPGLNMVGPTGSFAEFSMLSKVVFIFDMLAGRLEIFPMIMILLPSTWRKAG
ncbi:MAG: TrkH family potassium uptake protein [Oscillospiraceae bacterium]|nr:TrkH family potassium uptake protein [Oscillospiraceae bacterium]